MLIQGFYPRLGGAERQLQALIPPLGACGIDVTVVTRRYPGLAPRAIVSHAPIYRVSIPGNRFVASLAYTLGAFFALARVRRRVQVIHAHELLSPTTTAVLAGLVLRRPVVVKVLRGGQLGDIKVLQAGRLGRLRFWLFRRLVDVFIAISDEIEAELREGGVGADRIARIPNGVDVDRFRPAGASDRARIRESLGLQDRKVVLFLGRVSIEKGLDDLLDAWPSIRTREPHASLMIVGSGPHRSSLEARVVAGVHFVATVDDPVRYLQAADCFVLPSHTEGLSNSLLEAMATGLPCVATAVGGSTDVIRPGVDGWLVAPGDASGLGVAIVEALSPESARTRGAAARARVADAYSLQRTATLLAELYRRLAGHLVEPSSGRRARLST
jgi:glycosyltransferase involved in cell wall biosynthesis